HAVPLFVVEPVDVTRRQIDPQKAVSEPAKPGGLQVLDGLPELLQLVLKPTKSLPRETAHVEYDTVKGPHFHAINILAHERGVRLVPAPLDHLFLLQGFGRPK